jgi:hypothetical protein
MSYIRDAITKGEDMEVCTGRRGEVHEEIVHNESYCPLCRSIEDLSASGDVVDKLQKELNDAGL